MIFSDKQATIEIELNKDESELWDNLDKDAKWGINKAIKSGLSVEISDCWEDFYEIYKDTMIRNGLIPEEINKDEKILFVCKNQNKIIAGSVIHRFFDSPENPITIIKLIYNASLKEYQNLQPNNLLYWNIIKWGNDNGFDLFDLGGWQINARGNQKGINDFKERWGGKIKIYKIYSWNPFYIIGRKIIRNCPKIKKFRNKIKLNKYLK